MGAASYGMPGVKVDGNDALGLLKSSIRDDNPVVFVEHKLLYSQKGEVPQSEYLVPLGEAQVKREGTDATIVALSVMVPKALAAADKLSKEGISTEVIDPRTLVPLDSQTIVNSVKKTHRSLIVHEACGRGGFGAEILAQVEESEAFDYLDAPIRRLTGRNIPIPYSPGLERHTVPQEDDIIQAVRKLVG